MIYQTFTDHIPGDFPIVERLLHTVDELVVFMPFACYNDDIAFTGQGKGMKTTNSSTV